MESKASANDRTSLESCLAQPTCEVIGDLRQVADVAVVPAREGVERAGGDRWTVVEGESRKEPRVRLGPTGDLTQAMHRARYDVLARMVEETFQSPDAHRADLRDRLAKLLPLVFTVVLM